MPLLKKEPLERSLLPENIQPDDEVYYCKTTNEVFTDYDKLFERVILCNSLVWTCSMTGKSGLTYQDAVSSEEQAKELLTTFPEALKRPILFLSTLTKRRNLNDLVDDIFSHVKDKYFVGETVEAFTDVGNVKKSYKILKVVLPDKASSGSASKDATRTGSPSKVTKPLESDEFEYALQEISSKIESVRVLKGSKLMRKKGIFTREKLKLFLKLNCEADSSHHIWNVKESSMKKFRIVGMAYESIAPGPMPVFRTSDSHKPDKETEAVIDLTSEEQSTPKAKKASNSGADAQRLQEAKLRAQKDMQRVEEDLRNMRAMAAEKKQKKLEEKIEQKKKAELEKAKKLEEKKKEKEIKKMQIAERNVPREDLECDDLKDLPIASPVCCKNLKMECFGDLVFVKEFIMAFKSLLDLDVPRNFNIEKLLKALTSNEIDGDYGKILLSLVSSLIENSKELDKQASEVDQDSAETAYIKTSKRSTLTYGMSLNDLQLDLYTVSEITRMYLGSLKPSHLLNDNSWKFEHFVEELNEESVFELSAENKLQVLYILCHQLMSCNLMKTRIEDNLEKLKVAQKNLKIHQTSCLRRERDEIQYWARKKQEQRLKSLLTGEAKTNSEDNPKNDDPSLRKSSRVVQTIPDENFEKLPVENIDWEKISENEKQQMKMWEKRKEESLVKEVSELLTGCPVVLGFDRTHRQYWKFTSLPGVFVEDHEDDISGFKVSSPVKSRIMSPSRRKKDEEQKVMLDGKSNKENIPADAKPYAKCKTMTVQEQLASKGMARWSFYHQVEQVDLLIKNLSTWGIRESQLLANLKEHYDCIVDGLKDAESVDMIFAPLQNEKQEDGAMSSESSELENDMEKCLVENILDLEERIFGGALGKLKNTERQKWRDALDQGDYALISSVLSSEDQRQGSALESLSSALIQVERMVENRFIDLQLGQKDKKSKQKQKKKENDGSDDDASSTSSHTRSAPLDKWEANVRSATNLSQLFLSMSIIDNSISWSKSALNARCCICKRKGDGENMLLCDGCDKGHHIYCLKPRVKNIPEGDWFCPICEAKRPKTKVVPKKVETKIPDYDSETKDYDDFEQSEPEEESRDEEDDNDNEDHKKSAKQELLEKRFYSKLPATSKSGNGSKNPPAQKKTSQNNKRSKRKHDDDDDDDDDEEDDGSPSEVKRERKRLNGLSNGITSEAHDIQIKSCESLVTELMADENAWPFLKPVSKKDAPDYFDIIKTPMDFSRIRNKIRNFQYDRSDEIISDIRLIFENCKMYNKSSSCFFEAAEKLSESFEKRLAELKSSSNQSISKDSRKASIGSDGGNLRKKRTRAFIDSDSDVEEPVRNLRKRN